MIPGAVFILLYLYDKGPLGGIILRQSNATLQLTFQPSDLQLRESVQLEHELLIQGDFYHHLFHQGCGSGGNGGSVLSVGDTECKNHMDNITNISSNMNNNINNHSEYLYTSIALMKEYMIKASIHPSRVEIYMMKLIYHNITSIEELSLLDGKDYTELQFKIGDRMKLQKHIKSQ